VTRFDPGLQPERTQLAWRRTYLSASVGALVAVRLLPPVLGTAGLVIAGLGVVTASVLAALAVRRGRQTDEALASGSALPDGRVLLALALAAAAAAAVGLVFVARLG